MFLYSSSIVSYSSLKFSGTPLQLLHASEAFKSIESITFEESPEDIFSKNISTASSGFKFLYKIRRF